MTQDINVLALVKGEERYIFLYDDEHKSEALRTLGRAPWDYSYARRHVDGLVRPDFLPLWALYGLALERLHDALTSQTRPLGFPESR